VRGFGAQSTIFFRIAQILDEFGNLALGVVLARHVSEGDALSCLLLLLGAARQVVGDVASATEAAQPSAHHPPHDVNPHADNDHPRQQGGHERDEARLLPRCYVELNAPLLDHRQQIRIAELGNMRTEPLLRLALRPWHDSAQPALDLVAADRDLFDTSLPARMS
jgi:hypothetical protein